LRKVAIHRLGQSDDEAVGDELMKIYESERDREVKEQVLHTFSQMSGPRAYARLLEVARAGGDAEKLRHTVVESCAHGIVDDCATVGAEVTQADPKAQAEAYGVPCRRWGRQCDHVAQLHAPDGPLPDPAALRDAHEHACQFGDNDDCLGLARAYLAHQLPEPVPGRGKELATYLCSAGESEARDGGCAALHAADGSK
jgi:hypothetical protein